MADAPSNRLWAAARRDLEEAFALLPSPPAEGTGSVAQLAEWLAHNELGMAHHELEALGEDNAAPPKYWNRLWLAGRRLGLIRNLMRPPRGVASLHVGGLIAMGYDPSGEYLLTISHSGRGVFSTHTWERVARDLELAYPEGGFGIGIGPIAGVPVPVTEMDYDAEVLAILSPGESLLLDYDSGTISVSDG